MANEVYPPVRFNLGRPPKYTPEQLMDKFNEYLDWCKENPIVTSTEMKATSASGAKYGQENFDKKPRLVSVGGFLVFIGASRVWWSQLDNSKKDFSNVKGLIREYCEEYQKEMASGNVFNGNIISRLLGLADKQQVEANVDYNFKFGE